MGRPKKDIDPNIVEGLAARFCTMTEIAAIVGCDKSVISRRFATEYATGRERGKTKLRDLQWKSAQNRSVAMQIWLGKQYLEQRDKQDVRTEVPEDEQLQRIADRRMADLDRLLSRSGGSPGGGRVGPGGNGRSGGNGHASPGEPA